MAVRSPFGLVLAGIVLAGSVLTGCGSSASLGGHTISVPSSVAVPSIGLPGLPGVDLSKTDPASARTALCTATDLWLKADAGARTAIRPAVDRVISTYAGSNDPATRDLAKAARVLFDADTGSAATKRATWNRLCGG